MSRHPGPIRILSTLLVALAGAAGLAVSPVAGPAAAEGLRQPVVDPAVAVATARWREVTAIFAVQGASDDTLFSGADAAASLALEAREQGWHSPRIPALVTAVLASAKPDGGYGVGQPWDAFSDGSVNPESTSYVATTAGHVGHVLLDGYQQGAVPVGAVNRAIDSILGTPRTFEGTCISYSNSPNELDKPCVWNAHFGAAAFALRASRATGWRQFEVQSLVTAVSSWLVRLPQNPDTGFWPYSSAVDYPQDIGHQLWTASSVDYLNGNTAAFDLMLSRSLWREQAVKVHNYNVGAAMSSIAVYDCRYATDPLVLRYASASSGATPYALKAMSGQAANVLRTCFPERSAPPSALRVAGAGQGPVGLAVPMG